MAMNSDLVEIAKRIVRMATLADQYRETSKSLPHDQREEMMKQASGIDSDICAACDELRRRCREPYGRESVA